MNMWKMIIAAGALMLTAPAALAQVIVVDFGRVQEQSAAGKDVAQKLQAIGNAINQELDPESKWVNGEGQALQQSLQGKTPQQIQADAALKTRAEAFQKRQQGLRRNQVQRAREFQETQNKAGEALQKALEPVLAEVMQRRNATVVLDAQVVFRHAPAVDATDDVIRALDARTKTVVVTRVTLPPQPAQP